MASTVSMQSNKASASTPLVTSKSFTFGHPNSPRQETLVDEFVRRLDEVLPWDQAAVDTIPAMGKFSHERAAQFAEVRSAAARKAADLPAVHAQRDALAVQIASSIEAVNPQGAVELRQASPHWPTHTFGKAF